MKDLLDFITRDDAGVSAALTLEEEKKQTALLNDLLTALTGPGMNDKNVVVKLDLSTPHNEHEVWHDASGSISATGFTILAQEVDYWYGFEYGDKVYVPAGYIGGVMGHRFERLLITHTDASSTTMEIVIGGIKR